MGGAEPVGIREVIDASVDAQGVLRPPAQHGLDCGERGPLREEGAGEVDAPRVHRHLFGAIGAAHGHDDVVENLGKLGVTPRTAVGLDEKGRQLALGGRYRTAQLLTRKLARAALMVSVGWKRRYMVHGPQCSEKGSAFEGEGGAAARSRLLRTA